MNGRNFSRPVSVQMFNRSCPLNGIRLPRILRRFLSAEHAIKEVECENKLCETSEYCKCRYNYVDVDCRIETIPRCVCIITAWRTCKPDEVHRKKCSVDSDNRQPEM